MVRCYVELNDEGVKELLKSPAMQQVIKRKADQVQKRAGRGFVANMKVKETRCVAIIHAKSKKAYYANLKGNILLKALGND